VVRERLQNDVESLQLCNPGRGTCDLMVRLPRAASTTAFERCRSVAA
jgi:hypothetical protein